MVAVLATVAGCAPSGGAAEPGPRVNACPRWYAQTVCLFKDADYSGQSVALSYNDATYANNVYPDGGGVNDEVGSVINSTDYYLIEFYDAGYVAGVSKNGGNGSAPLCLAPGKYRHDTRQTWPAYNAFSSHKLYTLAEFRTLRIECIDYVDASGNLYNNLISSAA